MTKTEQKLSPAQKLEEVIIKAQEKDLESMARKEKSYYLWEWMREELIGRQIFKKQKFTLTAKGFSKVSYILASLREKSELVELKVEILDTQTVNIEAHFDLDVLDNRARYLLNAKHPDWNLELLVEDDKDEDYYHGYSD